MVRVIADPKIERRIRTLYVDRSRFLHSFDEAKSLAPDVIRQLWVYACQLYTAQTDKFHIPVVNVFSICSWF